MIELIVGLAVGLILFVCSMKSYTLGISHGKLLSNNCIPKVELNPVKPIVRAVLAHKSNKDAEVVEDELGDILGYSMETALNAVKKGR